MQYTLTNAVINILSIFLISLVPSMMICDMAAPSVMKPSPAFPRRYERRSIQEVLTLRHFDDLPATLVRLAHYHRTPVQFNAIPTQFSIHLHTSRRTISPPFPLVGARSSGIAKSICSGLNIISDLKKKGNRLYLSLIRVYSSDRAEKRQTAALSLMPVLRICAFTGD